MANDFSFMRSVSPTAASAAIVLTNFLFVDVASTRVPLLSSCQASSRASFNHAAGFSVEVSRDFKTHDSRSPLGVGWIIIVPVTPMILGHYILIADQKPIAVSHRTIIRCGVHGYMANDQSALTRRFSPRHQRLAVTCQRFVLTDHCLN